MIIDRRSFIRSTALFGAVSAIANFLSLSSIVLSHAAMLPKSSSRKRDTGGTNMNPVEFKIDGWNLSDAIAIDGTTKTSSDPATSGASGDQVWISISQSWRAAWR